MAKTLMLIVNPKAGRSRSLAPLLDVISLFSEAGYLVSLRQTAGQGTPPVLSGRTAPPLTESSAAAETAP